MKAKRERGVNLFFTLPIAVETKEFFHIMKNEIEGVLKQKEHMAIIMVGIIKYRDSENAIGWENCEMVLEKVKEAIRWGGLRTYDRLNILPESGEVIMVMHQTEKIGANIAQGRVEHLTRRIRDSTNGYGKRLSFVSGYAVLPENGNMIESLVEYARTNTHKFQLIDED